MNFCLDKNISKNIDALDKRKTELNRSYSVSRCKILYIIKYFSLIIQRAHFHALKKFNSDCVNNLIYKPQFIIVLKVTLKKDVRLIISSYTVNKRDRQQTVYWQSFRKNS